MRVFIESNTKPEPEYLNLQKAFELVQPAVCMVYNLRDNQIGTGFKVASGEKTKSAFIVTAAHLLYGVNKRDDEKKQTKVETVKKLRVSFHVQREYDAEIFQFNYGLDLALLRTRHFKDEIPNVTITAVAENPGLPIAACGYIAETRAEEEAGLDTRLLKNYQSIVSGIISARLPEETTGGDIVYQLDCTLYPGMSGGPVFTYKHGQPVAIGLITQTVPLLSGVVRHPISTAVCLKHLNERLLEIGGKPTIYS